jgi:hypothetical protein
MTGPFADRLFRIAFALAGCYNLAFGLWAALFPLALFAIFDLPPPRYPGIWACLGMVVGLYGFLYLHAAWKLETAWPIIAVGFLGKVLGPLGMLMSFGDDWPRRLGMICIYNDLIWWLPFSLFLIRGTRFGHWLARAAPWVCIGLHLMGSVALLFLRHGTLAESNRALRAAYIANHTTVWTLGWFLWMLSAMSFVAFCSWWGSYLSAGPAVPGNLNGNLVRHSLTHKSNVTATLAVLIAALGTVFDFSGEGTLMLLLVDRAASASSSVMRGSPDPAFMYTFTSAERAFTLLSAGAANLLYTIAGIILTLATPNLPKWVRASMWISWLAGITMTVAAVFDNVAGLVASSMLLFPLMFLWIAWMGARWRGP